MANTNADNAGSSPPTPPRPTSARDHPRSRGVDVVAEWARDGQRGSSPLARGRPVCGGVLVVSGRIIPARAGSTLLARSASSSAWDHPRSRGVDRRSGAASSSRGGSSPLARGRRQPGDAHRGAPRIIPARAGSTHRAAAGRADPGDHPRSRGVDDSGPTGRRGLPGIIPARAGSTGWWRSSMAPPPDHPRSRGVDATVRIARVLRVGSSPLARGRRERERGLVDAHWSVPGSSPLARGRHPTSTAPTHRPRIIPARAGSTTPCVAPAPPRTDHPRSRGVD